MSVLVYIEADQGKVKKSSLEAVAYGAKVAASQGGDVHVLALEAISDDELGALGQYGASKVLKASDERLATRPVSPTATAVAQAAEQVNAGVIIMPRSSLVDVVAPMVGVKVGATVVSNVVSLPDSDFVVKRGIFTGKAFASVKVTAAKKVLTLSKGAVVAEAGAGSANVESFSPNFGDVDFKVKITKTVKQEGDILLPEADKVVSAGRGLKAPENWGMIEELAKLLTAATACSKPVSDMDWRPHHEHVGQTGIKVSPDLYIAVGISGAIQHLAGVSSSKVIVVINKDPEAPFFKAADYGVVGDAFDVVPKLIEEIKKVL